MRKSGAEGGRQDRGVETKKNPGAEMRSEVKQSRRRGRKWSRLLCGLVEKQQEYLSVPLSTYKFPVGSPGDIVPHRYLC